MVPLLSEGRDECGVLSGEVVLFGGVGVNVIKLPDGFGGEALSFDEFPWALADGVGALVLITDRAFGQCGGSAEGRRETDAFETLHGGAVAGGGVGGAGGLHERGHDVHDVRGIADPAPRRGHALRPVDNEGRNDAALVGEVFVETERGVAEIGPSGAVGNFFVRGAHRGEVGAGVQNRFRSARDPVEAEGAPFVTRAVVGGEEDERVLVGAGGFELLHDAADAVVDVFHHGGVDGHAVGEVFAAGSVEGGPRGVWLAGVPVGDGVVGLDRNERKRAQFPAFVGDEADLLETIKSGGAEDVPPLAVGGEQGLGRFRGRLQREVRGGVGEVEEPRLLLGGGLADELLCVGREYIRGVEFSRGEGQLEGALGGEAFIFFGIPLVLRVAVGKTVELVEAAIRGAGGGGSADVPLAGHVGLVTAGAEDLREGGGVFRQFTVEIRNARLGRMDAGEQRGASRAAPRRV